MGVTLLPVLPNSELHKDIHGKKNEDSKDLCAFFLLSWMVGIVHTSRKTPIKWIVWLKLSYEKTLLYTQLNK